MEVCIDSVESAVNAEKGGANRVELCSNLMEGGTTPSLGMLKIVKSRIAIPVFVMIRPRGGDFLYSDEEFEVMKEDLKALKGAAADGMVFGILTREGAVDVARCKELQELALPLPVTFHRAFDMVKDPYATLDTLINLKFERLLTSGLDSTALEGLPMIKELVDRAQGRIKIIPGGGITERNLERIIRESGAREFHCSARSSVISTMEYQKSHVFMGGALRPAEFQHKITCAEKVNVLLGVAREGRK